ncbi:cdc48-dependent protein degradation adaptor protein [Niveomyces insectorum RCEF 264]|uniref:Cdc48-dependent protein degradation adaptor protein n=1 Tax=Niveomyces insectorum RCEF 264 TaxID=1081102 RepID=A0A162JA28_9HYPO|nr:cdc48-dependent protein degradation adaptor protein [Niveomyces insectorum RCEF 264]
MADSMSQDEKISSFCSITGVSSSEATEYLDAANWDSNEALAVFYQAQDEGATGGDAAAAGPSSSSAVEAAAAAASAADATYTGPRTLDGRPAPQSHSAASAYAARKPAPKRKGLATLDSLRSGAHDHHHDDEDSEGDDDEDDHGRGDLFAGGEKSGLAVQDPHMAGRSKDGRNIMRGILENAKKNQGRQDPAEGSSQPAAASRFRGSGQTLGGEGVESRVIPDPHARPAAAAAAGGGAGAGAGAGRAAAGADSATQERILHIWQDGFSIDDGPLHRFDDPNNAADLEMIRRGRAPLHLMGVQFGQAVDVKLHQHEEDWHQLPRVYRPFSGEGRRLGSPVPGASPTAASSSLSSSTTAINTTSTSATSTARAPAAAATTTPSGAGAAAPSIDESQPTVTIRVQLPDGARLPARFNTTQTIGDVYEFVQRALPPGTASQGRSWVLATTFPNKDHTDRSQVLGETPEFKRGGAAVVKWV